MIDSPITRSALPNNGQHISILARRNTVRWPMPATRQSTRWTRLDVTLLAATVWSALAGAWIWLGSLDFWSRDEILSGVAILFLVYPLVLVVAPRDAMWVLWSATLSGVALGIRYGGDMGADGHFIIGGFVGLSGLWSVTVGAAVCVLRRNLRASGWQYDGWGNPSSTVVRWVGRTILLSSLVCSWLWLGRMFQGW